MSAKLNLHVSSKNSMVKDGIIDDQSKAISTHPNSGEYDKKRCLKKLILFHKNKTRQLISKHPRDSKSYPEINFTGLQ